MNSKMKPTALFLMMVKNGLLPGSPRVKPDWLEGVILKDEYELIQAKKSKLSRAQRDAVIRMCEYEGSSL